MTYGDDKAPYKCNRTLKEMNKILEYICKLVSLKTIAKIEKLRNKDKRRWTSWLIECQNSLKIDLLARRLSLLEIAIQISWHSIFSKCLNIKLLVRNHETLYLAISKIFKRSISHHWIQKRSRSNKVSKQDLVNFSVRAIDCN